MSAPGEKNPDTVLLLPTTVEKQSTAVGGAEDFLDKIGKDEKKVHGIFREIGAGFFNLILFDLEWIRDSYHGDSPGLGSYVAEEDKIALQSDGLVGFFDQHMGNCLETMGAIYGWRVPIELVARVYETISDKKVDPHHKMALAILMGTLTTGVLEMTVGNGDKWDWFGSLLAGLWASGSWATAHYLSKPRETSLFEQGWDRWLDAVKKVDQTKEGLKTQIQHMQEWGEGLWRNTGEVVNKDFEHADKWMKEFGKMHEDAFDYIGREAHITELMFQDFIDGQLNRRLRLDKGKEVREV